MVPEAFMSELFDTEQPLSSSKLLHLTNLSDAEAAALQARWHDAADSRRAQLVEQLATITEDNAEVDFDAIFKIALDDDDATIRIKAIESLWECDDRWLLNRLTTLAEQDDEEDVRATAAGALGKFVLLGTYEELRPSLVAQVEGVLKRIIDNTDENITVRRRAIEAISPSVDPDVNDIIRSAYYNDELELRLSALYAMGQHCDAGWLPVLLKELRNSEPAVRFEATRACGEMEDQRAVPSLVELAKEPDIQVQEAALEALGHIGGDAAKQALQQCLSETDPRVREAAQAALDDMSLDTDPPTYS